MNEAPAITGPGGVAGDNRELADANVLQGLWTEEQYLAVSGASKRLIEFTDGRIEILPPPTRRHQAISLHLLLQLLDAVRGVGGAVFYAPLRLRVREGKFREPDLMLLLDAGDPRSEDAYWFGADLVMEIVSADDPARDLRVKRGDYAEARIPEYWVVNPLDETISLLVLQGSQYVERGAFARGESARGTILPDLAVDVSAVFDAR